MVKKVFLMFLCLVILNFGATTSFFAGSHRRAFTQEEDNRLIQLVKEHGDSDWKLIASKMRGRNVRQCRERWKHYLSALASKNIPFTLEEDELIRKKVIEFGHAWTRIAEFFPGRSDYQIKNRWFKILWNEFNNNNATQTNKVVSESADSTVGQPENSSGGSPASEKIDIFDPMPDSNDPLLGFGYDVNFGTWDDDPFKML